ncbi:MAG: hypothetical protein ABEN55_11780, partial [Bradymonadaceae bacterium]
MTNPFSHGTISEPDTRILILQESDSSLTTDLTDIPSDSDLQIDTATSISGAETRIQQRISTDHGYAGLVVESSFLRRGREAIKRLLHINDAEGMFVV